MDKPKNMKCHLCGHEKLIMETDNAAYFARLLLTTGFSAAVSFTLAWDEPGLGIFLTLLCSILLIMAIKRKSSWICTNCGSETIIGFKAYADKLIKNTESSEES